MVGVAGDMHGVAAFLFDYANSWSENWILELRNWDSGACQKIDPL